MAQQRRHADNLLGHVQRVRQRVDRVVLGAHVVRRVDDPRRDARILQHTAHLDADAQQPLVALKRIERHLVRLVVVLQRRLHDRVRQSKQLGRLLRACLHREAVHEIRRVAEAHLVDRLIPYTARLLLLLLQQHAPGCGARTRRGGALARRLLALEIAVAARGTRANQQRVRAGTMLADMVCLDVLEEGCQAALVLVHLDDRKWEGRQTNHAAHRAVDGVEVTWL